MGAADVVPGVSGGTMALILGIYQRLINAIKSFDFEWLRSIFRFDIKNIFGRPHFAFLVPLLLGIFIAILFFTRVVPLPLLIKTHPEQIYGLFFGLIGGSIMVLLYDIKQLSIRDIVAMVLGVVIGLIIFTLVPTDTPEASWFVFISGAVAICAMILPGISGSFVLLILKKYAYVLNGIGHFDFTVIIPFGLGAISGLVLFSRALSWLLDRYYRITLLFIVGLLIASLWVIWPFQHRTYVAMRGKEYLVGTTPVLPDSVSGDVLQALVMGILGVIVVIVIHWLAQRDRA